MQRKSVCVLIVTYCRETYLIKLLEALKEQIYPIKEILIFDNHSTDETPNLLKEKGYIFKIEEGKLVEREKDGICFLYFRNLENSGGSGGFHDGLDLASKRNCDYVWAMDDDVLPEPDCLMRLIEFMSDEVRVCVPNRSDERYKDSAVTGINLSNVFHYRKNKTVVKSDAIEGESIAVVDMAFEGPLLDVTLIKEIGLPKQELFIMYDDTEYAYRASQVTELRYVKGAILHKQIIPEKSHKRLMGWKEYYLFRNAFWFRKTYGKNFLMRKLCPRLQYIELCCRAIARRKWPNLCLLKKAYYDGIRGNLGKTIDPKENIHDAVKIRRNSK